MISNNTNSSSTPNFSHEKLIWSFKNITILIICGLITIFTILGNGLVLISIKFRLRARSYSDYFIVSLCLADFFVGLFVMPLMTIHTLYVNWPYHYRLCYLWMSIDFTCSTASFLTLASMSLDRYWALTAPYFHLRNRSYSSVLIFIISSWAIPFAIWPSSIFIAQYYNKSEPACAHPAPAFIIVLLCTLFYYIPLLFMLGCYSRIIVNIKNIEVLIKDTCGTMKLTSSGNDLKPSVLKSRSHLDYSTRIDKTSENTTTTSTITLSSIRSHFYKYFQRNRTKNSIKKESLPSTEKSPNTKEVIKSRQNSNEFHHVIQTRRRSSTIAHGVTTNLLITRASISSSPSSSLAPRRLSRPKTTATFIGQKRYANDAANEETRLKNDLIFCQEDDQPLVRTYVNAYRLSLPTLRYESCLCFQAPVPTPAILPKNKAVVDDHINGLKTERSQSYSASPVECFAKAGVITTDIVRNNSSFDNNINEEHRRMDAARQQPSRLSTTTYNSSRYSQRAIAQFMHERNKARLRRNQKASRMLGILLAVFLICWLPFIISYPTTIFYPNKLSKALESIIFWFGYANSLLNPFLYVYSSRNFRRAIVETLCCHVRLRSRQRLRYQWSIRAVQK